jgi:nucleosome binding factor SPN SPT16 subunit
VKSRPYSYFLVDAILFEAKVLGQIENAAKGVAIEIIARPKAKDASDALSRFFAAYTSTQKVGILSKETASGKLSTEWQALLDGAASKPELIDMTPAISTLMAIKDEDELVSSLPPLVFFGANSPQKVAQVAATLTSTLLKHHVAPKLESILDKESKITHEMLSVQIETRLGSGEGKEAKGPDMKVWSKGKGLDKVCRPFVDLSFWFLRSTQVDWPSVEFCYPPIIVSKSSKSGYDLKYTVESSDDNIAHKGVFLVSFGMRYRSYCTNVGRTFIVDPNTVCFS